MRLTFIVTYLGFMVSAKRYASTSDEWSSVSDESSEVAVRGYLNLKGGVRRHFALKAALEDPNKSMICSPLSVMIPLGKLAIGAGKKTEKELFKALHLSRSNQLTRTFAQLLSRLEFLPGVTLDVANRIFVSTENSINKNFAKRALLIFRSSCQKISTSDPKNAANTINRWVAEKTSNKINNVISSRDITKATSLIIVNVIYFAGIWLNTFDKTFTDDFFFDIGSERIKMMSRKGSYNYSKDNTLNAQIVEIPYKGSKAAMIIVLPSEKTNLRPVLRKLKKNPDLLNSALKKMKKTNIILTMPKFKIESEMDLQELYNKIGVRTIFNKKRVDLKGIIDDENVFVTKAIHKATIVVSELGTEASAATVLGVAAMSAPYNPIPRVTVNRPFLFYIVAHQEQLFAGIFNGMTDNMLQIIRFTSSSKLIKDNYLPEYAMDDE